ncbi:MAG: NADH-quinone oxidoreductase subunit J [Alphaproteobacteria bacterium]|nr:MAG: NADH-quinone oxidoreductase subunit J [Alphaproteobacteria bacterium]
MEEEFFLLLAVVATATGLLVVVAKNPIHSALALVACFVQVAALFILLGSPFLAVIQIFVYVGAVMVLFLFVIMMLDVQKEAKTRFLTPGAVPSLIVLLLLAGEMLFLLLQSDRLQTFRAASPPDQTQTPADISELSLLLFQDYLLPFEVASVILLVALVGAVVLAQADPEDNTHTSGEEAK